MEKNQVISLKIEDIGTNGEGIGHFEGITVFVKCVIPGDLIEARIIKLKKSFAIGKPEKIIEKKQIDPPCKVFGKCGGCQLMNMKYESQLEFKEKRVKDCLKRIGGLTDDELKPVLKPIIAMEKPFHYRNKALIPVGNDKGRLTAGFFADHSHRIVENRDCLIENTDAGVITETILSFMRDENVSAYNEETLRGTVRNILLRKGFVTGEISVTLIINADYNPDELSLVDDISGRHVSLIPLKERLLNIKGVKSISININRKNTNAVLGRELYPVYGDPFIHDYIGDIKYRISPLSFFQVNPYQTGILYEKALDYALSGTEGEKTVWDLYCGTGSISLFLAKKAKKVYGVEIIAEAIEDAKKNAEINALKNAEFFVGKAEEIAHSLPDPDIIVVDPPRKGLERSLIDLILHKEPERLVYVSCDPATLSRDLGIILESGKYSLTEVQPVDQFPHTVHVETIALLTRMSNQNNESSIKIDLDMKDYYKIKDKI